MTMRNRRKLLQLMQQVNLADSRIKPLGGDQVNGEKCFVTKVQAWCHQIDKEGGSSPSLSLLEIDEPMEAS